MMRECVWHVAAALLSFLSWTYCVNVMSDTHALDTTTELQFALLLLTSLCLTWAVVASFKVSETTRHQGELLQTESGTKGEHANKHKGSFAHGTDSSYQSKPLLDNNEKQCYIKDMERTMVVEYDLLEVHKAEIANTNTNWSLKHSNSNRSDQLLSCIILTSQTLLVITGVQTLKMLLHFFLKYNILFCHKDLLIAVHIPVCICVIEVSIAVVYLLRTYLCKEETDDLDETQKTILIS